MTEEWFLEWMIDLIIRFGGQRWTAYRCAAALAEDFERGPVLESAGSNAQQSLPLKAASKG